MVQQLNFNKAAIEKKVDPGFGPWTIVYQPSVPYQYLLPQKTAEYQKKKKKSLPEKKRKTDTKQFVFLPI